MIRTLLFRNPPGMIASVGLLVVRVAAGSAFAIHGWGKIQHPMHWADSMNIPSFLQLLAAIAEFGGGIAWVLGLLTPLAALGIACTMVGAVGTLNKLGNPVFVDIKNGQIQSGYELACIFLSIAVLLFLVGPGSFSADAVLARKKGEKK